MYQEFSVTSIDSILNKKQIIVTTNRDININSLNDTVIEIYDRVSKGSVIFDSKVDGKLLIITFRDWPIPNSEYILSIKGLKSVVDDELDSNIKKRIKFESDILYTVSIINPSMFEKVKECLIEFKINDITTLQVEEPGCYFEVSTDNAFIDVPVSSFTFKDSISITLPKKGVQYYLRARVQLNSEATQYGEWSEVITFIYGDEEESGEMPDITDPDIPDDPIEPEVDLEDFELISTIEQGVTPETLMLEFTKNIDELSLEDIIIVRKVVR